MQMESEDEGMGDRGQSQDRFSYVCDVRLKLINDPANIVVIEPSVDRPVRKPALKTRNFAISHLK
jgi:hypothetical protein